ncbi:hypothetical protein ScPMuIL_004036, partial [Solemya velum]
MCFTIHWENTNAITIMRGNDSTITENEKCLKKSETLVFPTVVDRRGHFLSYLPLEFGKTEINSKNNGKLEANIHLPTNIRIVIKNKTSRKTLILHKHSIIALAGSFQWEDGNLTHSERIQEDCSYQGYVSGHVGSRAAVSICGGLSGVIVVGTEELFIQPLPDSSGRIQHIGKGVPHVLTSCDTEDGAGRVRRQQSSTRRQKRQTTDKKRYLEVLIAADTSVVDYVGKDRVKSYLLALINIVNMVYQHETLDVDIEVAVVKIVLLNEVSESGILWESDAQRTVDSFCQWIAIQSYRTNYQGTYSQHDVAVLLTRTGIGPAGYAPITGMCNPQRSCAVVKDDGFTSAFIIAHEIAHVFGLQHDGHGNSCYGASFQTGLMATTVQSNLRHYWWSSCSSVRMKDIVRNLPCLDNDPHEKSLEEVSVPLGVSWSLDVQCRQEFGEAFSLCRTFSTDPCNILWCSGSSNPLFCKTKRGAPLPGTSCGHEQWCMDGKCQYHGDADPVDGAWGLWGEWSACSSLCGVGFQKRQRECNDPSPAYGGESCIGEGEEIDTCKSENCSKYEDVWAEQCMVLDQLPVRQRLQTWRPYQREHRSNLCELTCVSDYNGEVVDMEIDVLDGTPCSYDEPDNICLQGTCVVVGCDGVRNSMTRADTCGICGGDNSQCKTVQGTYNKKFEYSGNQYERVVVLPKGAKHIDIREKQTSSHILALKDVAFSNHILNGGGVQSYSKQFAANGAWFKYRNNYGHEVLESKGPLRGELLVEIYPVDYNYDADVTYRYTVRKDDYTYEKNRYHWQFENWSECSVSCGTGTQEILYGCYDKETSNNVDEEECQYTDPPHREGVSCQRADCDLA